jgi:glycosyltransferase involved in cell wall biosynthesis
MFAPTATTEKKKVLMVAYACNPEGTGEHWLGWGWAERASAAYHVFLIANTNHRAEIERHASRHGIEPFFIGLPAWYKSPTNRFGKLGAWLRQTVWQWKALRLGRELHKQHAFALVHQTTFHTFRIPFRLAALGIPSVWGPIAGGEYVPHGFGRYLGPARFSETLRGLANRPWLLFPPLRASLRRSSAIFVSNHCTLNFLPAWCHSKCLVVSPNALKDTQLQSPGAAPPHRDNVQPFHLLFVGHCAPTRAIPLVLEALRQSRLTDYRFFIVGSGAGLPFWQREAARLGVDGNVEFVGQLPQAELDPYYRRADVFVFPALRDSGGSGLLEAMSRGVPVVCLDWGGPGEMVDDASGIKIAVSNPAETVQELKRALEALYDDPQRRQSLGLAGCQRAQSMFVWDAKGRILEATYARLIRDR